MLDSPAPRRPVAEFIGLGGYNFLAMVRRGFFYTFLLVYLREKVGLSVTFVSLIGALNATASIVGQLRIWGPVSDRRDCRAGLMAIGEAIAGVGYVATFGVFALVVDAWPPVASACAIIACLATLEFFWSMTDVGFRAALAQVSTPENRGRYIGVVDLIGLVGVGLGLYLGGLLYRDGLGYLDGSLWYLAAGFILAGVPLIHFTLRHLDGVGMSGGNGGEAAPLSRGFLRFMMPLGVAVLGLWCFQHVHSFFIRLPETAAASDMDLSHVRTTFWIVGGLAALPAGIVMDRLGARRTYVWSLLACSLTPLLFLPTRSALYAAVTLGLFGVFLSAVRTASYGLAAELAPVESRGRHFAVYNAVMSLGWGVAGLLVGGPVVDLLEMSGQDLHTSYAASFVVGAALGLLGLALYVRWSRRATVAGD